MSDDVQDLKDSWTIRFGIDGNKSSLGTKYVVSLYWLITTFTTVGYGMSKHYFDAGRYCDRIIAVKEMTAVVIVLPLSVQVVWIAGGGSASGGGSAGGGR